MISNGAIRPFATVAMQTLARVKHDQAELGRAYQWMISKAAVISFPALTGFGMVAPLAIPAVFGPKWVEAGALAQVFAFMALPFTLNQFASPSLGALGASRSEEHTSELQSLMRISYAVFCLKKKNTEHTTHN